MNVLWKNEWKVEKGKNMRKKKERIIYIIFSGFCTMYTDLRIHNK